MEKQIENIKNFFKEIDFNEEKHIYTLNSKPMCAVSHVIKKFVEEFDSKNIAKFVAEKRGVTTEEILKEWENTAKKACELGTSVHSFAENWTKESIPTSGYEEAVCKFFNSLPNHIIPAIKELKMYSETLGIAGTSDLLLFNNKNNTWVVSDFKTNQDLFKNYKGKKLLKPFTKLLDCPFNKYQIQLSLYQILFQLTGYEVSQRKIIWLKPNGTFEIYNTQDYTKTLLTELTK
jgi:hypothetical protein